jgi:RNA polymerase sigma-70 factor, ECF subfamily
VSKDAPMSFPTTAVARANLEDLDEALDHLYERYAPRVERWVRRLAGPRFDCEDLIHDVFVVALRRRHEFRGDAALGTWLFRITEKVVRGRRRRQMVRRWLFARHAHELTDRDDPATPLQEIERRERESRLYAALERIPDTYRTPLVLYEIEGMPGDEIADLLGVQLSALWTRLHRGRARLLATLAREGEP